MEDSASQTIDALFEKIAGAHPERIAVADEYAALTYAELDERADGLAGYLIAGGHGHQMIGLSMRRSPELIVAVLAILKAGSSYVPIDPDLPEQRRRFIVRDSGVDLVLVDAGAEDAFDTLATTAAPAAISTVQREAIRPDHGSDALAYVIYTSGSTGEPKGVMVEHRQVLGLFAAAGEVFEFGPDDVWAWCHSYAFDFSVWEIFGALLHGGCVVVVSPHTARSPQEMWKLIEREGVTVLSQTPSFFAHLSSADDGFGSALRYVVFGGEALDAALLRRWFERYGASGPVMVNMYGITETTVHVTHRVMSPADVDDARLLIGRPLPHLEVRILNSDLAPAGPGAVGEICVAGTGLARGYLNRPGLTAERFVETDDGVRLYRSGDLGRVLDTGEIEFVGRMDDQVKIRGYRIEPEEVRHCLLLHERVADVAVIARTGSKTGPQLTAYFVPVPGALAPAPEELRTFAAHALPQYMLPHWFVAVDRFPLTRNGKLDRDSLPDPAAGAHETVQRSTDDADLATTLRMIWQEVLEVAQIDPTDRFNAVGGDSIQAIRVAGAARSRGIHLPLDELLANPTIESLAAQVVLRAAGPEPLPAQYELVSADDRALLPAEAVDAYPLTALQTGMLFDADMADSPVYHSVSSARVLLAFDIDRMRASISRLIEAHEALRTYFDLENYSEPLQVVLAEAAPDVAVDDLRGLAHTARQERLDALLLSERATPLDRRRAPMLRFRFVVLDEQEFVLLWSEHHAILDGWSSNTLLDVLISDYSDPPGAAAGPPPSLRELVAAEQAALESETHRAFWTDYLRNAPLPRDVPQAGSKEHEAILDLPAGTHQLLQSSAAAAGTTVTSILTAATAVALGVVRGVDEAVIGHVTHNRSARPEAEKSLGLYLNILPLRVRVSGTWRGLAHAVDAAAHAAGRHRQYPLAAIQRAGGPGFRLDNLVNYTSFGQVAGLARRGLIGRDGVRNFTSTSFPLVVDAERRTQDGELGIVLQFRGDQWGADEQRRFADALTTLIRSAADDLDADALQAGGRFELRSPHEATIDDVSHTVVHDILARAAEFPDAIAVADGQTSLTYSDLVDRVRRLALLLRARTATMPGPVAIELPRTVDLLVAMLAVFWTGRAAVLLDVGHPGERRRHILRDAGVRLLIGDAGHADTEELEVLSLREVDWSRLPIEPSSAPLCQPGDVAYIQYTSGTTGLPKGVQIEHRGFRLIMNEVKQSLALDASDVVLGWSSVTFDLVFIEFICTLLAGARLELLRDEEVNEPASVCERCRSAGVTVIEATPSKIQMLLDLGWPGARSAVCAGETLAPSLANRLLAQGATVWNVYGPSETTVCITAHRLSAVSQEPVALGRPLPGVRIRIVDTAGADVPTGDRGELWIGGQPVARGYTGRPELTAERFVLHAGERYYRSGDIVSLGPDGELRFHGRSDHQVKINGVRIEISEVEHVLASFPAVRAAAVVLDHERAQPNLCAFVVAGEDPVDPVELRGFLASRLQSAVVPSRMLFVGRLPLLAAGKVDRRALLRRLRSPGSPAAPEAVSGPGEQLVAEVWQAVLAVAPRSRDDRFFDLGGDSLAVMRAVGQYAGRGIDVRAGELMQNSTLAAQAKLVEGRRAEAAMSR